MLSECLTYKSKSTRNRGIIPAIIFAGWGTSSPTHKWYKMHYGNVRIKDFFSLLFTSRAWLIVQWCMFCLWFYYLIFINEWMIQHWLFNARCMCPLLCISHCLDDNRQPQMLLEIDHWPPDWSCYPFLPRVSQRTSKITLIVMTMMMYPLWPVKHKQMYFVNKSKRGHEQNWEIIWNLTSILWMWMTNLLLFWA